jgi:hypothetical protein
MSVGDWAKHKNEVWQEELGELKISSDITMFPTSDLPASIIVTPGYIYR